MPTAPLSPLASHLLLLIALPALALAMTGAVLLIDTLLQRLIAYLDEQTDEPWTTDDGRTLR